MGVGAGLYMYDVLVKSSRSLSHLLISSCIQTVAPKRFALTIGVGPLPDCLSYPVRDVGVLLPNAWMDQDATGTNVGLGPRHIVLDRQTDGRLSVCL